jgi:pyrroline-5-carboxylate reductase
MSDVPNLLFLGGGQMAEAIIRGVLDAGLVGAQQVMATDVRPERCEYLERQVGIRTEASNRAAVPFGQIIFLTVKPQDLPTLLGEVGPLLGPEQLVVSIAAGVPLARIESAFAGATPVIRVMPNTPALVRAGMAVLALGAHAGRRDEELVLRIFNAVGKAVTLPERALDAVTALSGSGPAFISVVVEALIDGGVRVGLPRDVATTLAVQTTLGTAAMLAQTGEHPARMKDMVTSPGGTAIAGVHALERGGLRLALIDAIVAATERSRELGKQD